MTDRPSVSSGPGGSNGLARCPNPGLGESHVTMAWAELVPVLERYIAIPALSPAFDPDWATSGHIDAAVELVTAWIAARPIVGLQARVQRLDGRTPLIVVDIPAYGFEAGAPSGPETVLLYSHLDKQPEFSGWRDGLGPWTPVRDGNRLYGRGGADDGYAAFASLIAIEAVQAAGGRHRRCVLLVEASEESGSPDLPAHVQQLVASGSIGDVGLVLCLDSGCANYDTLWLTTSLRGVVSTTVEAHVLIEGVHSGAASGVVPSSFRVLRRLLDRVEDPETGRVLLSSAHVGIPEHRVTEAAATATALGHGEAFPVTDGLDLMTSDPVDTLLARTWRPALSITGADGLPPTGRAGNVLRPFTSLKLSLRIPPTADPNAVMDELRGVLTSEPPSGADIRLVDGDVAPGWDAPDLQAWLADALSAASQARFGQPMRLMGEGGTIPFMGMLGERFPNAQFVITGVLGPESNAHGPNEFLHLAYAEQLTRCLADVIAATA
ncbi:MAG: M20/M25/M40 family metallo-hydrolase [Actinomycetota bacterium]|nr:M20/M25/M40 family metallo-hydrolase [Actinomycetota bacterium]